MSENTLQLGALLYPGFEMLDYFGPLEMFSVLGSSRLSIHTVAQEAGPDAAAIITPFDPKKSPNPYAHPAL